MSKSVKVLEQFYVMKILIVKEEQKYKLLNGIVMPKQIIWHEHV
jgi:hypothetical protein